MGTDFGFSNSIMSTFHSGDIMCIIYYVSILYVPDNFINDRSKDINDMLYNLLTGRC